MTRARSGGGSALLWLLLLGLGLMSLRACSGDDAMEQARAELDLDGLAPASVGDDFAAPPETRRIAIDSGLQIHEGQIADALRESGQHGTWSSFSWLLGETTITTVAPGLDRRHHFANAYLVGYAPYPDVAAWVPLAAIAQRKAYEYDHDQYPGAPELWQTSREAFFYPKGDCEDHAIALADWLIGLGHDARVVIGSHRSQGHAWVVVNEGERTYLLEATDKRPGRTLPLAAQHPDYQPEAMFNRQDYWVNAGSKLTTDYLGGHWELRSSFRRD